MTHRRRKKYEIEGWTQAYVGPFTKTAAVGLARGIRFARGKKTGTESKIVQFRKGKRGTKTWQVLVR